MSLDASHRGQEQPTVEADPPIAAARSSTSIRARAASGVRWTFVASAATALSQVGQLVVLARLLSPADFGLIGMLLIVVGFAQAYVDLGLSAALIYRRDATENER